MLKFTKAHAYGNDFLYLRASDVDAVRLDELARELCDRHTGIGADGLIVYQPTPDGASMRLFNADGGVAEVSGNGVRALGALLLDNVPFSSSRQEVTIETQAGAKRLTRVAVEGRRQVFRSAMGKPRNLRQISLPVDGEELSLVALDMGNPQAVLLGPLPGEERFRRIGAAVEHHDRFP